MSLVFVLLFCWIEYFIAEVALFFNFNTSIFSRRNAHAYWAYLSIPLIFHYNFVFLFILKLIIFYSCYLIMSLRLSLCMTEVQYRWDERTKSKLNFRERQHFPHHLRGSRYVEKEHWFLLEIFCLANHSHLWGTKPRKLTK